MGRSRLVSALSREQQKVKEAALREKALKNRKEKQEHVKAKANGIKKIKDGNDKTDHASSKPKKYWIPFEKKDKILLIGEGDFSFAHSLLEQELIAHATATSLDTEEELLKKYPSSITEHLDYLKENRFAELLYGIDGTKLEKAKSLRQNIGRYDVCIFNFPHLGNSVKDQDRNILQHQKLMMSFFASAKHMINPITGKILITLFDGEPYVSWNIKQLARANGFALLRSGAFEWDAFPGYQHHLTSKEGHTSKPQHSRFAKMYLFELYKGKRKSANVPASKSKRKKESDDSSEDE